MALIYTWEAFIRLHGGEEGARNVFEIAMEELLKAENPDKEVHRVRASRGDGGIDVYVHHKDGIDICQCKFFMGSMTSSKWSQIQHSFDRAMEPKGVKVLRWFICMPRQMQQEDIEKWDSFLKAGSKYGVPIRYIDGDEIINRMLACDRKLNTNLMDRYFDSQTYSYSSVIRSLPAIIEGKRLPCEPYVDGISRKADLENIGAMLRNSKKVLWLYGDGGIGKTELVRRFADTHPEYEYIFTTFKGSVNQTVSQNLFSLPGYEHEGSELTDEERRQKNYTVFKQYSETLRLAGRGLILVIDNYYPAIYTKKFQEETDLDLENGFAGDDNDMRELQALRRTGVRVILTSRIKLQNSDSCIAYKVGNMCGDDLFEVMTGCFEAIGPGLGDETIRVKLRKLIEITDSRTAFVTIMAYAMQNSGMPPEKALDEMLKTMDSEVRYYTSYSDEALRMQGHMEKILGFMNLTYQENEVLTILTLLPPEGLEYRLFRKLTISNSVHLDKLRKAALWRLADSKIVILEERERRNVSEQPAEAAANRSEKVKVLRMNPLIAECALRKLAGSNVKVVLNSIKMNWTSKLLNYFDRERLEKIKTDDVEYPYISLLADACSGTELALQKLGERFAYTEDDLCDLRRGLLYKAADLSDKIGRVKDAVEYIERAAAVEGPSAEDMQGLWFRIFKTGVIYDRSGRYREAEKCYIECLKLLNDNNYMVVRDAGCLEQYSIDELAELDDANNYAALFDNMSVVYAHMGDYWKALEYCGKSLALCERVLGTDHKNTATAYNNMASLYKVLHNYGKALEYYGKALTIAERVFGTDHPSTAKLYDNIGNVHQDLGDYGKALEYKCKALAIFERELGSNHPSTATTYYNMGSVYQDLGDYGKALEYRSKALAIFERVLGMDHPNTKEAKEAVERVKNAIQQ